MEEPTAKQPGEKYCHACGKPMSEQAITCPHCGAKNPLTNSSVSDANNRRIVASIFAILLGGFGAHKFYLGDTGLGVLYLCFFWTGIPAIVGIIEGIIYLTMTDEDFARKYIK